MAVSITNVLNTTSDSNFDAFDLFLQENPQYLTTLDDNGQTPLHVAIQGGNLRLIQLLIKRGARLEQVNRNGDSALRMAAEINDARIVKYLVENSTDLSSAFRVLSDLKISELMPTLACLGIWLIPSFISIVATTLFWPFFIIMLFTISMMMLGGLLACLEESHRFSLIFFLNGAGGICTVIAMLLSASSGLLVITPLVWSVFIANVAIFLFVTLCFICKHLLDNYIQAPGYIGEQQQQIIKCIESERFNYLNTIFAENINWLFPPVASFSKSAMMLLARTEKGRAYLASIMPQVAQSESALNNLLNADDHKQLLIEHPELFKLLVDSLSIANMAQHNETLFDIFASHSTFFRENSQASIDTLAKLTLCGMGWERNPFLDFVPQVLESHDTSIVQLAKGYIAKCGWYGCPQNDSAAIVAFKAIGRENIEHYIQAQQELAVLHVVASGSEGRSTEKWIKQFFQGLSHYHNLLLTMIDSPSKKVLHIQATAKDFLADLLDQNSAGHFFTDLLNTNSLSWKTKEGDTPILLAAKLGYWELVELILQEKPESIDTEQYGQLLLTAVNAKKERIVELLVEHPKFSLNSIKARQTENSPCHEAIRVNHEGILTLLLKSDRDLSHQNNIGDTPIVMAAKSGHWHLVKAIYTTYPTTFEDESHYSRALLLAIKKEQLDIVQGLVGRGALSGSRWQDDETKNSACHEAIRLNNESILMQLLDSNRDLHHQNIEGDTPIVMAAKLGYWQLVKAILTAHPTTSDDKYQYGKALFVAIKAGQTDVVEGLVNRGALLGPAYVEPSTGDSYWHAAVKQQNVAMFSCLLAATDEPIKCLYHRKNDCGQTVFALSAQQENLSLSAFIIKNYPNDKFRFFKQADSTVNSNAALSEPEMHSESCCI